MKRTIFSALFVFAFVCGASAQEQSKYGPEWGDTPEQRSANVRVYNLLNAEVVREDWGIAAEHLQHLLREVPTANPRIYIHGMNMYRKRAEAATDPAQKLVMADSLIMLHEEYLKHFAERYPNSAPDMWNNLASYTKQYHGDDNARVMGTFRRAVESVGGTAPALVVGLFTEMTGQYVQKNIDVENYLDEYDALDGMLEKNGAEEVYRRQLEKLFVDSGAADCENIESSYGAKIEADPTNVDLLDRTMALLNRAKCTGDFYMDVAEKYYKVKPTARTAQVLAAAYRAKGDNATAAKFIQEAIAMVAEPKEKVELLLGVAATELAAGNFRSSYNHAREAAAVDPQSATASYLQAIAMAGGSAGCGDAFAQRTAYWLAYDKMQEARRLAAADSSTKPEMMKDIETNIARYAAAFPTAEELFLATIGEGSAYTVNCGWVSGRTTVRRRP